MKPYHDSSGMRGFTIVELLIVIVIVSILSAIAVPSYRQYVMRTNRTVAKAALQDLLTRQENYAVDHKSYSSTFTGIGIGSSGNAFVTSDGRISDANTDNSALYQFTLQASISTSCAGTALSAAPVTIAVTATPIGSNQDTVCGKLCLGSNGDRGATPGVVADCWRR